MTTTASSSDAAHALLTERVRLSRHVVLRPAEGAFVLESALTGRTSRVASPGVLQLLLAVAGPVLVSELLESVPDARRPAVLALLARFRDDGVLTSVDAQGRADDGAAGGWEFHDLFFHARSRRGRNPAPVGASYPLRGHFPPEPLAREGAAPGTIPLPRPDAERLASEDPPLGRVLESRRSLYSVAPVTLEALGELLFRSFRVTGIKEIPGDDPLACKVYPSAGGLHSLELNVVPWSCDGVERGVWRYRPHEHALEPVCGFGPEVELLLEEARAATGVLAAYPPVLLVLSARFRRVAWKYSSLAYAAILKEVGGVFQTLYLVSTAMGLSPCALGAGDSDRFARVAGTDYYRETSVGEFIVGGPGGFTGPELARRARAGHPPLGGA